MWVTTRTGKAKVAISWFFFVTGATLGNWASLLPFVKDEQNISNGELGLILLAAVAGALIALPIITYFNDTYGSGWSVLGSGIMMVLFFPLVGIKNNLGVFILGVCMLGFVIGCLDVSSNGQAVLCEKMTRAPTLGLFHAIYSIGALSGALIGGVIMEHKQSVLREAVLFGVVLMFPGILLSYWLYSPQEERLLNELHDAHYERLLDPAQHVKNPISGSSDAPQSHDTKESNTNTNPLLATYSNASAKSDFGERVLEEGRAVGASCKTADTDNEEWRVYEEGQLEEIKLQQADDSFPLVQLLLRCGCGSYVKFITLAQIALLGMLASFGEGAVNDWSVIYFADSLGASPFVSTLGFAGFELTVACGRYFSDHAVQVLGRQRLIAVSGAVASLGMGIVVLAPSLLSAQEHREALQAVTILGFSICGLGVSSVAPSAISLAGSSAITRAAGLSSAESIAMVTSVGYIGIMVSPPFLGGMSVLLHSVRWSFAIAGLIVAPIVAIALCIRKEVFASYSEGMREQRSDEEIDAEKAVIPLHS